MTSLPGQPGTWEHLVMWDNGAIDVTGTAAAMARDDMRASAVINGERPGMLHYVTGPGTWHIWDGKCHRPDASGTAGKIICDFAARYLQALEAVERQVRASAAARLGPGAGRRELEAAVTSGMARFETAAKYAAGLRRSAGMSSLLRYLATVRGVSEEAVTERHPDWLNFTNGTLDLRTGTLRPHDPADMITYCLDVPYDPQAACPRYWNLIWRAAGGDREVAAFLGRLLGYSVLGWNPEQVIVFLSGPTASGKSKVLEAASTVLGPLAHESQAALICLTRHGRNARTENSIRGARLVTITETSAFMHVEEAQVKRLTGEAWISVDQHYAKTEIRTPVTWMIVLATNKMPSLLSFDDAMARRTLVLPMGQSIPAELRNPRIVPEIVAAEAAGIASWLAGEAMAYFRDGLAVPAAVREYTARYAASQDTAGAFIADRCVVTGTAMNGHVPPSIARHELWQRYEEWARGGLKLGRNEFYAAVASLGGVTLNEASRRFEGLQWAPQGPLG